MIEFFENITNGMFDGNFSFLICILNFLQLVVAFMAFVIAVMAYNSVNGKKRKRSRYKSHKYKVRIKRK